MAALAGLRHEWQRFRADPPGHRFCNHHERWHRRSRVIVIARLALGTTLLAAGIVMLFTPGPGLLVTAFGLGLFAGHSRQLARALDRVEPRVRHEAHAVRWWWQGAPALAKAAVIALAVVIAVVASYALYRFWFP
jgi:hypothetical protein